LRDEDLTGLGAEVTDLGFEQLNLLARAAAPHLQEAIDYRVEVDVVLVRHCKVPLILQAEKNWRVGNGCWWRRAEPQQPTRKNSKEEKEKKREKRKDGARRTIGLIHFWHWYGGVISQRSAPRR